MSVKHASVTVGTTAVSLTAGVADKSGNNDEVARSILISNTSDASVYLGGPGVTSGSYGYELKSGLEVAFDLLRSDELWAVAGSAGKVLHVLSLGV